MNECLLSTEEFWYFFCLWMVSLHLCFFFLLPPQHIWASKVSVTLFSVGDYSTDSRKIKPMEVKKIGLNGWIFNWVVRRAVQNDCESPTAYQYFSQLLLEVPSYESIAPASIDGKKLVSRSSLIFGLMTLKRFHKVLSLSCSHPELKQPQVTQKPYHRMIFFFFLRMVLCQRPHSQLKINIS